MTVSQFVSYVISSSNVTSSVPKISPRFGETLYLIVVQ